MIPLLRVDLRSDLTGDEYPSRILWSEDNPGRPPQQRGMKLMLDPVSLLVIVDDLDMIPSGHWIKVRMAKVAPETEAKPLEQSNAEYWDKESPGHPLGSKPLAKGKKHGSRK